MTSEESTPRRAFTFEWQIEKFNHWNHVNPSSVLKSPRFNSRILDGSVFRLHLFPCGVNERDSEVSLAVMTLTRFRPNVLVDCEWCCLGPDRTPLATRSLECQRLEAGKLLHLPKGPMQMEVFDLEPEDYIPHDTFTVQFRIWESGKDVEREEYVLGRTRIDIREESLLWPINGFSALQFLEKVPHPVGINFFPCLQKPLALNFFLASDDRETHAKFEVVLGATSQPLWFCCNISFLENEGKVSKSIRSSQSFNPSHSQQTWNIETPVTRAELLLKKEDLLLDDVLNIHIKTEFSQCSSTIETSSYGNVEKITEQRLMVNLPEALSSIPMEQLNVSETMNDSIRVLLDDIETLFKRRMKSDFELRSEQSSFSVHKNILSVRSPGFKALFTSREAQSWEWVVPNSVHLPDIDAKTLEMLLVFIYTGKVKDLNFPDAINLYHAAQKHDVSTLKQECSSVMRSHMDDHNMYSVLELAERYQDKELMSFVESFIENRICIGDEVDHSEELNCLQAKDPVSASFIENSNGEVDDSEESNCLQAKGSVPENQGMKKTRKRKGKKGKKQKHIKW